MPPLKPSVMITGFSGLLGGALVREMKGRYDVLGVARRGPPDGVSCDLSDEEKVKALFKSHKPALVLHTAAYSDVDGCEREPKKAYKNNALSCKYLSQACATHRVPWIYVSTDYVFGGRQRTPYREKDIPSPMNSYGLSKWCGEFYALSGGVSSAVVRTSWLFGPDSPANFVNAILRRLHQEKKVAVLDDQTDSPTSVKDLSQALMTIGEYLMTAHAQDPSTIRHDTFHVCNRGATTRYEMTVYLRDCLGLKGVDVEKVDRSRIQGRVALRAPYLVMSTAHYEHFFKQRLRTWQESLKEYAEEVAACAS